MSYKISYDYILRFKFRIVVFSESEIVNHFSVSLVPGQLSCYLSPAYIFWSSSLSLSTLKSAKFTVVVLCKRNTLKILP